VSALGAAWTTPGTLRAIVGAVWAAALVVFLVALSALRADRASLATIAHGAAPTIVRAETLAAHLADLDTELASSLLGDAATREASIARFEGRRHDVHREIVAAAEALAAGASDPEPMMRVEDELGRYLEDAARARALQRAGDAAGALLAVHEATQRMHERVLTAATALDRAERGVLDREYTEARAASTRYEVAAVVCAAILVGVLVRAQVFVRRRLRRRIAPGLLAATALAVAFVGYLVGRLTDSQENLRLARDDAFDSIHLLWRATAIVYDARGDEARWLLDRSRADEYDDAFRTKTGQLWGESVGDGLRLDDARSKSVTGLLADEARNVTFEGERGSVEAVLQGYVDFLRADDGLRALERQGKHGAAIERWASAGYDAPYAFDALCGAMQRTIDINQRAFDAAIASSDGALRRAEWLDPAFVLGVALLAWLGVRARLREYA
jgi:hypothetical protein